MHRARLFLPLILAITFLIASDAGILASDPNKSLRRTATDDSLESNSRKLIPPFTVIDPDSQPIPVQPPPPGYENQIPNPDDIYWSGGFGPQGGLYDRYGTWIYALAKFQDKLVAGGFIDIAGSYYSNGIAMWDGQTWQPMNSGVDGNFGYVFVLCTTEEKLYAGGEFKTISGDTVNNIATWDGASWSGLGEGVNGYVSAIIPYGEGVIVGGSFSKAGKIICRGIAYWNGFEWEGIGGGVQGGSAVVNSIALYDYSLIVAGGFDSAGGVPAKNIASWNGSNWTAIGPGINGTVRKLAVYQNKLIAAGTFTQAGGEYANRLAAWDGNNWSALGVGPNHLVLDITVHHGQLIVAGVFNQIEGQNVGHIAGWDGNSWLTLDTGLNREVYSLLSMGDTLVVGGRFAFRNTYFEHNIAFWDGAKWSAEFENGIHELVFAFAVYNDQLIAGGDFGTAGGVYVDKVAKWNGKEWSALGSFINPLPPFSLYAVTNLTVFNSLLIAGGHFDSIGGIEAKNIAAWDGENWRALGGGTNTVGSLIEYDGRLYAGVGYYPNSQMGGIIYWDGESWHPFARPSGGLENALLDMMVYNDKLVVAGNFDSIAGISARCIASWDGRQWETLGKGLYGYGNNMITFSVVRNVAEYNGRIIAGGAFSHAGDVIAFNLAQWDGNEWSPLGEGISYNGWLNTLTIFDGKLIVGGVFFEAGDVETQGVAAWNGENWSSLGSGLDVTAYLNALYEYPMVYALANHGEQLFVGGIFSMAGDKVSENIAVWNKKIGAAESPKVTSSEVPLEFALQQNYPNPFNPSTTIEYDLSKSENVLLEIYNVLGQKIITLVNERRQAGRQIVHWSGQTENGISAASGVYFYKLRVGETVQSRKMLLLK